MEGCLVLCVSFAIGGDSDFDFTSGFGIGPREDLTGYVNWGSGENEGPQVGGTCGVAAIVGGQAGVNYGTDSGETGGYGGFVIGEGFGCSAGYSYTY